MVLHFHPIAESGSPRITPPYLKLRYEIFLDFDPIGHDDVTEEAQSDLPDQPVSIIRPLDGCEPDSYRALAKIYRTLVEIKPG